MLRIDSRLNFRKLVQPRKSMLPLLVVFAAFFFLILNIIPSSQPFEGVMQVEKLSFTSSEEQPFLSLADVKEINLSHASSEDGSEFQLPIRLGLGGSIQSEQLPELNAKSSIIAELTGSDSFSMAAPGLSLSLGLTPQAKIQQLNYDAKNHVLSFYLYPDREHTPTLEIYPPNQPLLNITLSRRSSLKSPLYSDNTPLSFKLATSEFSLPISAPTNIRIQLPPKLSATQPFAQALYVKDVNFLETFRSSFADIATQHSTIIYGRINLGRENPVELSRDQFLQLESPGIQELSSIRTQFPNPPNDTSSQGSERQSSGLQLGVVGKTKLMQVGLSERYPVIKLEPSVLSGMLSPTQVTTANGFAVGIATVLLQEFFAHNLNQSASGRAGKAGGGE